MAFPRDIDSPSFRENPHAVGAIPGKEADRDIAELANGAKEQYTNFNPQHFLEDAAMAEGCWHQSGRSEVSWQYLTFSTSSAEDALEACNGISRFQIRHPGFMPQVG